MQEIESKQNGAAGSVGVLDASEWNQLATEIENIIKTAGIALNGADLEQASKAFANYTAFCDYYTESGTANAKVLTPQGLYKAPTAYATGMRVRFICAVTNTGAVTINVAGLGVVAVTRTDGVTALIAGDMVAGYEYELFFDGTLFRFKNLAAGLGTMAFQNASAVAITGGAMNGVAIGASNPSTAKVTTLEATGLALLKQSDNSATTYDGLHIKNNADTLRAGYGAYGMSNKVGTSQNSGYAMDIGGAFSVTTNGTLGFTLSTAQRATFGSTVDCPKGADLASAATVTIANATGNYVYITGTTTITSLGANTAGATRIVEFRGILTLTHNASSLNLPGNANITTAVGDCAVFCGLGGSNWKCVAYMKNDGTAVSAPPSYAVYRSGNVSGAAGTNTTFTHNLNGADGYIIRAVCTTAELGFSVGQSIDLSHTFDASGGGDNGLTVRDNAVNSLVVYRGNNGPYIIRSDTNAEGVMNWSNWSLQCTAWKFN